MTSANESKKDDMKLTPKITRPWMVKRWAFVCSSSFFSPPRVASSSGRWFPRASASRFARARPLDLWEKWGTTRSLFCCETWRTILEGNIEQICGCVPWGKLTLSRPELSKFAFSHFILWCLWAVWAQNAYLWLIFNTRSTKKLNKPLIKTNVRKFSISYKGVDIYNSLPNDLKKKFSVNQLSNENLKLLFFFIWCCCSVLT